MRLSKLREQKIFIVWKRELDKNGRATKVPYGADGFPIGTDEKHRARLETFAHADAAYKRGGVDGIGFVFVEYVNGLYICGVDIDHQDPKGDYVKGVTALFPNAYIETSPSGEGVHIVLLVDIRRVPTENVVVNGVERIKLHSKYYSKNGNNGVECYVAGLTNRYFTHTGATIQDGADVDQTTEFLKFLDIYMLKEEKRKVEVEAIKPTLTVEGPLLTDEEILTKARAAKNGQKFCDLFDNGGGTGYESQSNADQALMNILAFWTGHNAVTMERLFSLSALGKREKWQSRGDYRRMTIERAINDCKSVYEPPRSPKEAETFGNEEPATVAEVDEVLKPSDFTDVGEALTLAREYSGVLRHSAATKYIDYDGRVWRENEARARGRLHELTRRQLEEHEPVLLAAIKALEDAGRNGSKALIEGAKQELDAAQMYQKFILRCRNSKNISGVMREAQTPLEISVEELDKDGFLLNTPTGEVDLRTGALLPHNPASFHTKITAVSPSEKGTDLWNDLLKLVTCGDKELEHYLQLSAGQMIIGKVFAENIIIAHGTGRNGKSTLFNVILRCVGDYGGQISAETLTTGRKTGKNWELAELRGKRFIVAPELEEGTRLDAAFVKKICSTDKITGEKKYKDPFDFEPSHTIVLYTNHLPKVGSNDAGTWRRLIVVPFNAKIEGANDKKNYADYLFRKAGGACLAWVIEGARKYIAADYKIEQPECVKRAIDEYKNANDWLSNYLTERCEVDKTFKQKSGELYSDYRSYCLNTGDYARSAPDFKAAIESAGFETKKTKTGAITFGLRLIPEFPPFGGGYYGAA